MPVSTRLSLTRVTRSKSRASTSERFSLPSTTDSTSSKTSRSKRKRQNTSRPSRGSSAQGHDNEDAGDENGHEGVPSTSQHKSSGKSGSGRHPKQRINGRSIASENSRPSQRNSGKGRSEEQSRPSFSLSLEILVRVFEHLCAPDADHDFESGEVFWTIADNLVTGPLYPQPSTCHSGWKSLFRLSLVAKTWGEAAQLRLFRDPHVVDALMLQRLIVATKEPRLGEAVQTVTLADANFPVSSGACPQFLFACDGTETSLSTLINNCPNLQKIYLGFPLTWCFPDGASFPSITTLRLSNWSYGQNTMDMIYLLSRLPALQTLILPPDKEYEHFQDIAIPDHLRMAPLKNLALTYITHPTLLIFLSSAIQHLERLVLIPSPHPAPTSYPHIIAFMNIVIEKRPPLYFVSLSWNDADFLHGLLRYCVTIREIRTSVGSFDDERMDLSKVFRDSRANLRRITFICMRIDASGAYSQAFFNAEQLRSLADSIRLLISMQTLEYIGFGLSGVGEEYDVPEIAFQELHDACQDPWRRRPVELDAPHEYYMINGRYIDEYIPMMDNWLGWPTSTTSDHFPSTLI